MNLILNGLAFGLLGLLFLALIVAIPAFLFYVPVWILGKLSDKYGTDFDDNALFGFIIIWCFFWGGVIAGVIHSLAAHT